MPTLIHILWVACGWFCLAIVVKSHGGLTNMLAGGIGEIRENEVELYSTASPIEKMEAQQQIEREAEFQKEIGIGYMPMTIYFILIVAIYGFIGPASVLGLMSIPAGADVWGFKF